MYCSCPVSNGHAITKVQVRLLLVCCNRCCGCSFTSCPRHLTNPDLTAVCSAARCLTSGPATPGASHCGGALLGRHAHAQHSAPHGGAGRAWAHTKFTHGHIKCTHSQSKCTLGLPDAHTQHCAPHGEADARAHTDCLSGHKIL